MHWCHQETEMLRSLYPLIVFPLSWLAYKGWMMLGWVFELMRKAKDV